MPRANCIPVNAGLLGSALLAVLTVSCDGPDPTAPAPAAEVAGVSAPPSALQVERPFHLDADAVLFGMQPAPDFGPPLFGKSDFDGRCSVPSDLLLSFSLEGRATRLGWFTGIAEHCSKIDFAAGRTSIITDGEMILTAANGDELWSSYVRFGEGEGVPEEHTFVGGTGRFAGASGEGLGHPDCNRETGTCTFTLDGVIHYDASDRAD